MPGLAHGTPAFWRACAEAMLAQIGRKVVGLDCDAETAAGFTVRHIECDGSFTLFRGPRPAHYPTPCQDELAALFILERTGGHRVCVEASTFVELDGWDELATVSIVAERGVVSIELITARVHH